MQRGFGNRFRSVGAVATLGGALLATATARAAVDYDQFNYTGTALNGQNGGQNWSGAWFNTATTDNVLSNDGVSLSYPTTFQSPLTTPPSAGSHIKTGGLATNASSSRQLSSTVDLSQDGNVMYVSVLIQKNTANAGGVNNDNVLLEFVDAGGNRRFGLGIEGTGDRPWLNANGSTSAATAVTPGSTYFLVAKIVSAATPNLDTASLYVFGDGYASEVPVNEPGTADATLTENTGAILDRIRVRIDIGNTSDAPGEVDDIRIGTSWSEVVSVPEPTTAAVVSIGAIGLLARRRKA